MIGIGKNNEAIDTFLSLVAGIAKIKVRKDKMFIITPKSFRDADKHPLCSCGAKLIQQKPSHIGMYAVCAWCLDGIGEYKSDSDYVWECEKKCGYVLCSDGCEKARPNTYCWIPKKYDIFPEACLSLSKGFVLNNPLSKKRVPITMDDALNGYNFGFSYHILAQNSINVYLYHNCGGTLFRLKDIEWAWPRWFDKIDGKEQTVPASLMDEINRLDGVLRNEEFDAFYKSYKEHFVDCNSDVWMATATMNASTCNK